MERKQIAQTIYRITDCIADLLESEGYEAKAIDINNNYRPEPDATDVTEMTEFIPVFAHRYAAVAAGVFSLCESLPLRSYLYQINGANQ